MLRAGTTNEETRNRWIKKTLEAIPEGLSILDAGAGQRPYQKHCGHLKYLSHDFAQYHGNGDTGLQTGTWDNGGLDIISDIVAIPLDDRSVDVILCTEVLEHVPYPIDAIKEFSRLIRPGGYLILTAPFSSLTHFAPFHFSTGFSQFFYQKHLPENGFTIQGMDFNGNFFEQLAQESRRIKMVAIKYAGRRLNLFEKVIIHLHIWVLQKLSAKEQGSSELLCFGIHILARREK